MRRIFELGGIARAHYRGFAGRALEIPPGIAVVAHTHCLPSAAATLFPWLLGAGLSPDRLLVITKPYSTIPRSLEALTKRGLALVAEPDPCAFPDYAALSDHLLRQGLETARARFAGAERLLLLDDGGMLTECWSSRFRDIAAHTISIQQTSSGVRRPSLASWHIPYVDIARSVAKTVFEAPAIAGGITRKLCSLGECARGAAVGIVGLGAIGARIATSLAGQRRRVLAFDTSEAVPELRGIERCATAVELIDTADIIIGCTGTDWMSDAEVRHLGRRPHVLVSASSRDVEFGALLRAAGASRRHAGFEALELRPPGGTAQRILNGGYPVNFDRRREWESGREMVLTRLLLFAGVLQALDASEVQETTRLKLDPALQQRAVSEWLRLIRRRPGHFGVSSEAFEDPGWWANEPEAIIACLAEPPPRRFAQLGRIRPGLAVLRKAQALRSSLGRHGTIVP